MNAERKIFALKQEDPAYENGARYAVCIPAWSDWLIEGNPPGAHVAVAYMKSADLETARKAKAEEGWGVFSTYPGGLECDFSIEIM